MGNINSKGIKENTYDAIVIGSGISGGWAAKEIVRTWTKNIGLGKRQRCKAS